MCRKKLNFSEINKKACAGAHTYERVRIEFSRSEFDVKSDNGLWSHCFGNITASYDVNTLNETSTTQLQKRDVEREGAFDW